MKGSWPAYAHPAFDQLGSCDSIPRLSYPGVELAIFVAFCYFRAGFPARLLPLSKSVKPAELMLASEIVWNAAHSWVIHRFFLSLHVRSLVAKHRPTLDIGLDRFTNGKRSKPLGDADARWTRILS